MSWHYSLDGTWVQFPPEAADRIEAALRRGEASTECADHGGMKIHFYEMISRDDRGGETEVLRDRISPAPPEELWQWHDGSTWVSYSYADCELLSLIAATEYATTTLRLQSTEYRIDTVAMQQMNTRTNFSRIIRKISASEFPLAMTSSAGSALTELNQDLLRVLEKAVIVSNVTGDAQCPICLLSLKSTGSIVTEEEVLKLPNCACPYHFHRTCLMQALMQTHRCPMCRHRYILARGNQPEDGEMNYFVDSFDLPGNPGTGTIVIEYSFPAGTQGSDHPNPGTPYNGTHRTAFLPNSEDGREILQLLSRCFRRRLTFTVGTSITTGLQNQIVWNGVHHKASQENRIDIICSYVN